MRRRTGVCCSAAAGAGAAGIALAAGPATDQSQLPALVAGVAFVALHAGDADLLLRGVRPRRRGRRVGMAVGPIAVLRERSALSASGRVERVGGRLGLDDPLLREFF